MSAEAIEIQFKGSDTWETVQILGRRKGYLRLGWADGKSKWVDLNTITMKENDNVKVTSGSSTDVAEVAGETEEEVEAAAVPAGADAGSAGADGVAADFSKLRGKNYFEQAAFFLNAYWLEFEKESETIYSMAKLMAKQDRRNGDKGTCLDEVNAMKILQDLDMALSRPEYLAAMRKIDVNNDKKMSMLELCLYKYKLSPAALMSRPQNGMTDELRSAYGSVQKAKDKKSQLDNEKAELEELASGTGVKAMQARTKLPNFKKKEYDNVAYELKQAQKAVEKALKSPELREKGTEFINAKLGIASAPKKAVGASAIGVDDYKKVDFETQLWKEDLIFWIREATYLQQAGFFLNAYWSECGETAEAVWEYARSMIKFDTKNGEDGIFLDQNGVNLFLKENITDFSMTAVQLRKELANKICLNNDKKMSLIEFLLYQMEMKVEDLMTRPQGEPSDTVRKMKIRLKQIEQELKEWDAKIEEKEKLASGSGAKAMAAKNQMAQGYGTKEKDLLVREQEKCQKKLNKAEATDDLQEPGFLWIMQRAEQYANEPGRS